MDSGGDATWRSPLAGLEGAAALAMREIAPAGKVIFRGNPDEKVRNAFNRGTGLSLPLTPNTASEGEDGTVLWLGPNEWLVRCAAKGAAELCAKIGEETAGLHTASVDVSDYYTVIRISGPHARDALAHGCPLDLHPSAFAKGDCAQSRFESAAILLHQCGDEPAFDIQVRWSHAEHVWRLLGLFAQDLPG